jgi:hypothetical protein
MTLLPRQAAQLVAEHDPGDGLAGGNRYLEWVSLGLIGDRARNAETRSLIVEMGTDDEGRPTAFLLMTFGRIEIDPDEIAGLGATRLRCRRAAPSWSRCGSSPR